MSLKWACSRPIQVKVKNFKPCARQKFAETGRKATANTIRSARLLMGVMNFKNVTTYRKIIKRSCAKSSTAPSITAATDKDAHSYTQGLCHQPHPLLKSKLPRPILPQMLLFIVADSDRLAPLIKITTSAVKLKDCLRILTI